MAIEHHGLDGHLGRAFCRVRQRSLGPPAVRSCGFISHASRMMFEPTKGLKRLFPPVFQRINLGDVTMNVNENSTYPAGA